MIIKQKIYNNEWENAKIMLLWIISYLKNLEMSNFYNEWITKKIIEIEQLIKYFSNNKNGLNFDKSFHIGSNTETFISHIVKNKTTRKFSIYSVMAFKNIVKYKAKENKINLFFV